MTQQLINISPPGGGTGDSLYAGGGKINANFTDLYSRVFDVRDYGAVFNGSSDLAPGIQAAVDAAKTYLSAGNFRSALISFPIGIGGLQQIKTTINFTGFTNTNNFLFVNWNQVGCYCPVTGKPVIDAMGSKNIRWNNVFLTGAGSPTMPTTGIQYGRINTTALDGGGSGMIFDDCRIVGSWSLTGLYNFSGESCIYYAGSYANDQPNAYGAIMDGINHFGVTSAYVTQNAPANSPQSFNQNLFIRTGFGVNSNAQSAIWKSGCRQHEYQSCYIISTNTYAFTEYCVAGTGGTSVLNKYDLHVEGFGSPPAGYFLIDGNIASPTIRSFEARVAFLYANRVFKILPGSTVTSVTVNNMDLNLAGELYSPYSGTFQVFDNPAPWTINDGNIKILDTSYWNYPNSGSIIINNKPYITADML